MNNNLNPKVNLPYPKIIVNKKDPNLAYKLFELYAGNVSELTDINQYSFQSIYLCDYVDLSNILKTISITEMEHLRILGELIKALGLNPYFISYDNNKPIPWNSDYVNFTINYREMLVNNIKIENESIEQYNKLLSEINDENIRKVIERIILDERKHVEIFSKLLMQYDSDQ
ncbi:MAG: manganese catalase family protein [Bacilli bacterium]|nr:manganese catalase family protein [Bacilli bacterium]